MTFWASNWTNAGVLGGVNVTHGETGALTGNATGTHNRETAKIINFGERVNLLKNGTEAIASKKFVNGGDDGAGINESGRSGQVLGFGHTHFFLDGTL